MKKLTTYSNYKLLLLFIAVIIVNSCKKENSISNVPLIEIKSNKLINDAKNTFNHQIGSISNYQTLSSNSKKSYRHGLSKSPDWKNAAVKTLRNGKAVLVPIEYEKDIFLKVGDTKNSYQSLKTLSYLLIYNNKEKTKTIEWITLMPDDLDYRTSGNKFNGKVIIEDWAGNFKKGYVFNKDGKIFNLNIQNENIEGPKVQSNNVKVNDVYCISTPWYGQNISGGESFWYIGGYDTSCYSTGSPYEDNYINTGNELGGNHGETFPSDYITVIGEDKLSLLINSNSSLTEEQKSLLNNVLINLTSDCGNNYLFNILINKPKISFSVNSSQSFPAIYNPSNNSITFKNDSNLEYNNLQEELFHAFQNYQYAGGTSQYTGSSNVGSANIEFESKVFRDINCVMRGGTCNNALGGEYVDWILNITNFGTSYPSSISTTNFNLFIGIWRSQNPGYSNTTISTTLTPIALNNFLLSSNCN